MRTEPVTPTDLRGVFSVPPLCRADSGEIAWLENQRLVDHIAAGGITRLLYGGNAMLYHITLGEYDLLLRWLVGLPQALWAIPSVGPAFGFAIEQARLLRGRGFPCAMVLPCNDPKQLDGLEQGLRAISAAAELPLVLYLKEEHNFGPDPLAGLDLVASLLDDGVCAFIKYAVVRPDPARDPYLEALLARVDRARVVSGIGERPAVIHLRDAKLPGFTTGSGCVAPRSSQALFTACARGDFTAAEQTRGIFLPLEDIRDAAGPAAVLHAAVHAADIARSGPLPPFSALPPPIVLAALAPVAKRLRGFG